VTGANAIQMLMVAGLFGMFFLGVLYLQRVLGYDAVETGLAFLPVAGLIGALSLGLTPRLNLRFGARATLLPGLVLVFAGLALIARAPVDGSYVVDVLPTMVLFGLGAGLSFPSLTTLAMSGATASDAGLASGLVNTSLQVGGALGLSILATLAGSRTDALLSDGQSAAEALTGGYSLAFILAAGLVAVAVALAATVLRSEADAAAEAQAEFADGLSGEPAYAEAA
jgi:sugar phosphate permease